MKINLWIYAGAGIAFFGVILLIFLGVTSIIRKKTKKQDEKIKQQEQSNKSEEHTLKTLEQDLEVSKTTQEAVPVSEEEIEKNQAERLRAAMHEILEAPESGPKIIFHSQNTNGEALVVEYKEQLFIGRRKERNTLIIEGDQTVSGIHCKIYRMNGVDYIEDLNSRNGTALNGHRVRNPQTIKTGDIIQIGRVVYKVEIQG